MSLSDCKYVEHMKSKYPGKFAPEEAIFRNIHRGDRIFIGTACGEPQYLVQALINYVNSHPKAIFDAEVYHVWTLGVAPYADQKFKENFRHNSFFVGPNTRGAVNEGLADYTPIFLSQVPELFRRRLVPIDVALVQVSPPDCNGHMSLGVSVDITKPAVENASLVIAQINSNMPRVHGDTFVNLQDVDFVVQHDEPLLEDETQVSDEIANRIGGYVGRIVEDGDTIQVGYGSIPNAILSNLKDKKHLGVHTELLSDGIVELMKEGVVDNSMKALNHEKSVAAFSMGKRSTYEFINDNPAIEFRPIDYTNNPLTIARHHNMTAINSCLQIDLTGQATAESLGPLFYSGIGGQADFMRGTVLSPSGKTILVIESTARDEKISRVVPFLDTGAGVTLNRSDVRYVISEYGIAYLHGKNIRERAMELISIAHPKFRGWLIDEAKKRGLIYQDQKFIPGKAGEYPEELESYKTTKGGIEMLLRPVRISDEPLLKGLFHKLSDNSLYLRFISMRKDMPHERLQEFVVVDYTKDMVILAVQKKEEDMETLLGIGQYSLDPRSHTAEAAFAVRDDFQGKGVGHELLCYLIYLAKRRGLLGLTAEVLAENLPMLHLFEKLGFKTVERDEEMYSLKFMFNEQSQLMT